MNAVEEGVPAVEQGGGFGNGHGFPATCGRFPPAAAGGQRRDTLKETDHNGVVVSSERWKHFVLAPLVGVYLLNMLITLSCLGETFPFMGTLYSGDESEALIFVDSIVCLYLIIGILKRQQLTLWLLIAYNFVNSFNGITNLFLLPVQQTVTASGAVVPDYHYRLTAFGVFVLFLLLNIFLYLNRRHFDNKSVYLW